MLRYARIATARVGLPIDSCQVVGTLVGDADWIDARCESKVNVLLRWSGMTISFQVIGSRRGKKRVVTPWFVNAVFLLRLLPVSMMDALAGFFGINHSMDHFIGRQK